VKKRKEDLLLPEDRVIVGSTMAIVAILLENMRLEAEVFNRVMMAAAKNEGNGQQVMTFLLDRRGSRKEHGPPY
jgi:hypothetical protein